MSEPENGVCDLRLWGKEKGLGAPYPVLWHLIDTAAISGCLWDLYLSPSQRSLIARSLRVSEVVARMLVSSWAGLHDLGKITDSFQSQHTEANAPLAGDPLFPPAPKNSNVRRHEAASQLAVFAELQKMGYSNMLWSHGYCYRVAQLLGGHHGRFHATTKDDLKEAAAADGPLGRAGWHTQRAAHFAAVYEAVGRPPAVDNRDDESAGTLGADVASILTGVIILADWLASQEWLLRSQHDHLPTDSAPASVRAHLDRTVAEAPSVLRRAGLGRLRLRKRGFVDVFGFAPNPLQASILDELTGRLDGPGLLVVTAATGDGKTEVGLAAALAMAGVSGIDGIHFALPTMATADQMYRRVASFVEQMATGAAPVTLLHSMSWLNSEYAERARRGIADPTPIVSSEESEAAVGATDWLRGAKRGLLASVSAGTIDQALLAVLPVKHNALRMLGLSRKVLVVDEAHAYDSYMQTLLRQLLCWLGALGVPVVLLSATLPSTVAGGLVAAYLRGARGETVDPAEWVVDYPGWVFASAQPGRAPLRISTQAANAVATHRTITLNVETRPVTRTAVLTSPAPAALDDRMTVIRSVLEPIASEGGCVAIVCNTVREAQDTYLGLRHLRPEVDVVLLHARFPAGVREQITSSIVEALGRDAADVDRRPPAMIVIATQVIEQSLDLDFDLVISDLGPIAQLLQRAGRCHRHQQKRPRPEWVAKPRLVVLDPVHGGTHAKPRAWGTVYSDCLLRATHLLLADRHGRPVQIPGDVQEMVETVYVNGAGNESFAKDTAIEKDLFKHQGEEYAQRDMAGYVKLPDPARVSDLALRRRGRCQGSPRC
jgi:CRISPR-associated endonuclease/helicase Cas3